MSRSNILTTAIGTVVPLIIAVVTIPTIKRQLTDEDFSLLIVFWTIFGYLGFLDLGISKAMVYYGSIYKKNPNSFFLSKLVRFNFKFSSVIIIITSLIGIPVIATTFKFEYTTSSLIALLVAISIISNIFRGLIEGLQMFFASALFKIFSQGILFVAPYLLLNLHTWSFEGCLIIYLAIRFFACMALIFIVLFEKRTVITTTINTGLANTSGLLNNIFRYGFWILVSSIVSPLMVYGDRFFILDAVGPNALSKYFIIQEPISKTLMVSAAIFTVLQTKFTIKGESHVLSEFFRLERSLFVGFLLFYIFVVLSFPFILDFWVGEKLDDSLLFIIVLSVGLLFNSMAQMGNSILLGFGKSDLIAKIHLIELMVYIPLLMLLINNLGLIGAAFAWSLRAFIDFVALRYTALYYLGSTKG